MTTLIDYFGKFDIFAGGLLGFFSLFILFYIFIFLTVRGKYEKPHEKTLQLLLPPILVGFFLNWFGVSSIIVGIAVLLTYLAFSKGYLDQDYNEWISSGIGLFVLLIIFGILDIFIRNILFVILLIYAFVSSEKEIHDKKNEKEKKEKE